MKGCIWSSDESGNVLMRKFPNNLKNQAKNYKFITEDHWEIIENRIGKVKIKEISINEKNLWMISLDGEVFSISNIS